MKLHEYQAKEILRRAGIPVPEGTVVSTPDEARVAFTNLETMVAVIKAQIHAGGRGKAGGVKSAYSADEAGEAAAGMLDKRLVTAQTGPEGVVVKRVLVEAGLAVEKEYYLAIAVDRDTGRPVVIASASGGMDIEEVARVSPEKIIREYIEPVFGLQPYQARKIAYALGVAHDHVRIFVDVMLKLHVVFLVSDLELVELNPLVLVEDDDFVALDAKMVIDDNSLFRHDELQRLDDPREAEPLEYLAKKAGVSYIKLDGAIGCMVNGAGLAMATMDMIKSCGGEPANFLDVGGGASAERIKSAFEILISDPQVQVVLVNIFGGILRCDELAHGVVSAAKELDIKTPVVVRLEGTNKDEGVRILAESGLSISVAHTMREAAETAVHFIRSDA